MYSVSRKLFVFLMLPVFFSFCAMAQDEDGLTAYYDFETAEALDQSGNGLNGVVEGNPALIDGAVGKAWDFDGATRVDLNYDQFKAARAAWSVSCSILPKDDTGKRIIFEEGGAWTGMVLRIRDGQLQFGTVCCGEQHELPVAITAPLPETGGWIAVAGIFDNGKLSLYIDGKKAGEADAGVAELGGHGQAGSIGEANSNTAFSEGPDLNVDGPGFFVGGIDELRIYSRALQAEDITTAVSSRDKLANTWGSLKISY